VTPPHPLPPVLGRHPPPRRSGVSSRKPPPRRPRNGFLSADPVGLLLLYVMLDDGPPFLIDDLLGGRLPQLSGTPRRKGSNGPHGQHAIRALPPFPLYASTHPGGPVDVGGVVSRLSHYGPAKRAGGSQCVLPLPIAPSPARRRGRHGHRPLNGPFILIDAKGECSIGVVPPPQRDGRTF